MRDMTLGQWAIRLMVAGTFGLGGLAAAATPAIAAPITVSSVTSTLAPLPVTETVDPPTDTETETEIPSDLPTPLMDVIWA